MKDEEIYRLRQELLDLGEKSPYFNYLSSKVIALCRHLVIEDREILNQFQKLWFPFAVELAIARRKLNRTLVQGILGGQGVGKSTLCQILKQILNYLGCSVATLSIDDLYLTYPQRQELRRKDPRLIWRGPPGTHDVNLGIEVIDRCRNSNSTEKILMPRFDKSAYNGAGDRSTPEAISKPDILLFEGWFVGVQPMAEDCFTRPPAPIITAEDIRFAKDSNRRLRAYLPLWDKLDSLMVLYPEDYRLSKQWRKEAEHKMIATEKTGMSDAEIDRFVEYFWKSLHPELFIEPLTTTADLVVEIKRDRTLGKIYRGNKK